MFKPTVIAVTLVLLGSQITLAETWMPIAEDANKTVATSVDSESISRRGSIVSFWKRNNYSDEINGVVADRSYMSVNCRNGLYQFHRTVEFNSSGMQLSDRRLDSSIHTTVLGSVGEAVAEFVCQ